MIALLTLLLAQTVQPVTAPSDSALRAPLPDVTPEMPPAGPVLPLAEALREAREQSPDLAVALERIAQSENQVKRAWATLQPTLTANGSLTYNSYANQIFNPDVASGKCVSQSCFFLNTGHDSEAASLNFAWNLFNLRAYPAIKTAYRQIDVAKLTETQQRRELLLSAASVYYSGVTLRELEKVSRRQAQTTLTHAKDAQARYEAGLVQLSAALRARIDYLNADQEVRRAQFNYTASKSQLAALLDRRDTDFELAPPDQPPDELRGAYKDLLEKALQERPEMAASRANEEIAGWLKTDAWAQFMPSLAVTASARYNHPSVIITGDESYWSVALALTLPLYDGGFRYVAMRDAESQMRQAKAQTRAQSARIEDELRRAMIDLDSARALRDEADQTLRVSRENERLVKAQFDAGTASQVEVSDAETALFQSEANALQQRLAVDLSALRLAKAVGAFDVPEGAEERGSATRRAEPEGRSIGEKK